MQESCPKGEGKLKIYVGAMLNVIGETNISLELFEKFKLNLEDKEYINVSSIHSRRLLVISGKKNLIEKCRLYFKENNIQSKLLNVSAAFHSKLMEIGMSKFSTFLEDKIFNFPKYGVISTVKGHVLHYDKSIFLTN